MMKEVLLYFKRFIGVCVETSNIFFIYIYKFPLYLNELAYSSFPHFPYMGYCKDSMMVICRGSCAALSQLRQAFV